MAINKYSVSNPDPILETASSAEGTVARLAHVNDLVDQVNDTINYKTLGFGIVAVGNVPNLIGVGDRGSFVPPKECGPGTVLYTYTNGSTGCITPAIKALYADYLPVVARTDVGVYTFTFRKEPVRHEPVISYDVLISPPAVNGSRISIVKTTNRIFTVTTTNSSGVAADGLLTGSLLEIKIYN